MKKCPTFNFIFYFKTHNSLSSSKNKKKLGKKHNQQKRRLGRVNIILNWLTFLTFKQFIPNLLDYIGDRGFLFNVTLGEIKWLFSSLLFGISYTFYYNFLRRKSSKYTLNQIHRLNIDKWHVILMQWNSNNYLQHWVHFYPFHRLNKVCIGISKRLSVKMPLSV